MFKESRYIIAFAILAPVLLGSACIRRVAVAEKLEPEAPVPVGELVNRINSYQEIDSISAQVEVYVRDYFTGAVGMAREFPGANAALRLQRPEKIRMRVTAPVINSNVADMTSDGDQFRLAIYYPSDKRMFVHGSNLKNLHHMGVEQIKETQDPRLRDAGALANIRPQHITDAFIIKPILGDGHTDFFREEVQQEEDDTRPGKKGRRVKLTYYVLYVLERGEGGQVYLRRKFWFDRTKDGTPLVRQQTFENGDGKLGSDVYYGDYSAVQNSKLKWAKSVVIKRPNDGYDIWFVVSTDSMEVNAELPPMTFVLDNRENLRDLDLDQPHRESVSSDGRPQATRSNH